MHLPSIPAVLIIGVLIIYLIWKLMVPAKKKPEQRRFSIRKHRKKNKAGDEDNDEGS